MVNYGRQVKEMRTHQRLSLNKLSALSGVRATTIFNWESYGRVPPVDKLDAVLKALGISIVIGQQK